MKINDIKEIFKGFGRMKSLEIEQKGNTFDREVYHRGDVVAVMLFDSTKGLLLTNQIRPGILYNEPHRMNSFEIIAGMCEEGMSFEEVAKKEALEEAGYDINPNKLFTFYSSPGAYTERVHLYFAHITDKDKVADGGGSESENEYIDTFFVDVDDALEMINAGQIDDAKTIVGIQWFKNN